MSRWLILLSLSLAGCTLFRPAHAPLYADRKWAGPIWISASAEFDEFAAARALADAAEQVTGVRPEVLEEGGAGEGAPGIFVGRTATAARDGVVAPSGDGDTAVRRTVEGRLHIVGNSPVATRIAVGRFCEEALGITFVMPGIDGMDYVPLGRVEWPDDANWRPAVAWRSISGLSDAESIEWQRRVGFGDRPACTHGLAWVFTPELYAKRPDLFAEDCDAQPIAPTQGGRSAQPDLAEPAAAEFAAAYLRRRFQQDPGLLAAPLGINDSVVYGRQPGASWKGVVDGRPNRSDYVFGFLNRVAALGWNPGGDHAIGCLAYLDAYAAPSFPVAPEIFPAICADRIQYANPAFAKMDSANLAAWGRSGARRIGTWDYLYGRDIVLPRWHLGAQAEAFAAERAAGICSWYAELDPLWAYDAPKAWVAAKLADDRDADAGDLAERWARAAYGPAAPAMLGLQRRIEQVWAGVATRRIPGQWLVGWRDGCSADELLSPALEADAAVAIKAAQAAIDGAPRDARHNRMRKRLAQFNLAWEASLAEARRCRLANAIGAGTFDKAKPAAALWSEMLAVEIARDGAQAKLNTRLWPGSQPVQWSASAQPNPWPLIAERMTPAELALAALPKEAPAAARVALAVARRADRVAPADRTITRRLPRSLEERLVPGSNHWCADLSRLISDDHGTAAFGPQGNFRWTVQVAPGEILRVTVDADVPASFAEGLATLVVRFPGGPKPPKEKPLHAPAPPPVSQALPYEVRIWGRTVLEVPAGDNPGDIAEVEIAFVDRLHPIRDVTIERLPALPRR